MEQPILHLQEPYRVVPAREPDFQGARMLDLQFFNGKDWLTRQQFYNLDTAISHLQRRADAGFQFYISVLDGCARFTERYDP